LTLKAYTEGEMCAAVRRRTCTTPKSWTAAAGSTCRRDRHPTVRQGRAVLHRASRRFPRELSSLC